MIADLAQFADRWHLRLAAICLAVGIGVLLVDWASGRRRARDGETVVTIPLTLAIGLIGLWATVPDTEAPLMAAGALCPVLFARAARRRGLVPAESVVVVAAFAAATVVGSAGRVAAITGAVCSAVLPVALVLSGERGRRVHPGVAFAVEVVACFVGSRIVGQL